ncbi:MAG TPA: DMT family transporter [Candidatus Saccharimonadales bacterium]|nr:DMT family transporter [Candidatus Saccharimonadales bacterium]
MGTRVGELIGRMGALAVAVAAALWATDAYFRPALTRELSASQIVFGESLLIAFCFLPVIGRVRRELRDLSLRQWIAMAIIALGAQAFATVLFTQALSFAFPAHAAPDFNVENEVYLLYLLQPVFGIALARIVLKERRKPYFWPLAAGAVVGVYLIVFPQNPLAPFSSVQHGQLVAAALILGAVLLWASGTVFGRYSLSNVSFVTTAAMRFTLALPVLFVLMIINGGFGAIGQFSVHQIPSFIGIALIPGLLAMLLYYRALSNTPASMASIAELGYPCTLFLVFSLPAPVGLGFPFYGIEIVGAVLLVGAVTTLNVLKHDNVVAAPQHVEPVLAHEGRV